jgi:hypothetical protein
VIMLMEVGSFGLRLMNVDLKWLSGVSSIYTTVDEEDCCVLRERYDH